MKNEISLMVLAVVLAVGLSLPAWSYSEAVAPKASSVGVRPAQTLQLAQGADQEDECLSTCEQALNACREAGKSDEECSAELESCQAQCEAQ